MIAIVDYGAGNLRSVRKAFSFLGFQSVIADSPAGLSGARRLVLPGVGSFGFAAARLGETGLTAALEDWIESGRPLLGICLGLQLLTDGSEEAPGVPGFGTFGGTCRRYPCGRVPQIGWNGLKVKREDPLLSGITSGEHFYFANSYHLAPAAGRDALAVSEYHVEFPSVLKAGRIYGTQFHPEKSGLSGLKLLRNWVESC